MAMSQVPASAFKRPPQHEIATVRDEALVELHNEREAEQKTIQAVEARRAELQRLKREDEFLIEKNLAFFREVIRSGRSEAQVLASHDAMEIPSNIVEQVDRTVRVIETPGRVEQSIQAGVLGKGIPKSQSEGLEGTDIVKEAPEIGFMPSTEVLDLDAPTDRTEPMSPGSVTMADLVAADAKKRAQRAAAPHARPASLQLEKPEGILGPEDVDDAFANITKQ